MPLELIEALAREITAAGEAARRITVVGAVRNVGTTVTAVTLARSLARTGRVVLIDLALGSPNLSVIASDPAAPGIADLIRGSATFGEIITRDRHSRVHLVMAGRGAADAEVIASPRLAITLEALARSYDHLIIDAGALPEIDAERFAQFAPRAVLVAGKLDDVATIEARERLLRAGFIEVSVLASGSAGPCRRKRAGRKRPAKQTPDRMCFHEGIFRTEVRCKGHGGPRALYKPGAREGARIEIERVPQRARFCP